MNIAILPLGAKLKFIEYTSISIASSFLNTFLPFQGGIGLRAIYLKSRYNFDYTLFISTLAGNYIIIFNVVSIIGLVGMIILYFKYLCFSLTIFLICMLIFIISTYAIFFNHKTICWIPLICIKQMVENIINGWIIIKQYIKNVIYLYILTALNFAISTFILYYEFNILNISDTYGSSITLLQSLFISLITTLSLFVSVTPASLGIREGLVMMTSHVVNIAPSHALTVTILDRCINISLLSVLAYPAVYLLKAKKEITHQDQQ